MNYCGESIWSQVAHLMTARKQSVFAHVSGVGGGHGWGIGEGASSFLSLLSLSAAMSLLRLQKRLASSVLCYGKKKVWLDGLQ